MTADAGTTPVRVAVAGASGLLGSALVRRLAADGHPVLRMVRRAPRAADEVRWDPTAGRVDAAALEGVDAVVNLAGESVAERWTPARKARIRESREGATRLLATTLAGLKRKPRGLVNASAVGLYGNRADERLDETSAAGGGVLGEGGRGGGGGARPAAAAGG